MDWFSVLKEGPTQEQLDAQSRIWAEYPDADWEPTVDLRTGTSTDVDIDEDDCCDKIIRHLGQELRVDAEQDWIADQIESYIGNCDGFMEDWAQHFGIHENWEYWAKKAGCTPFSEDTGFTTGEPMEIAMLLLKEGPTQEPSFDTRQVEEAPPETDESLDVGTGVGMEENDPCCEEAMRAYAEWDFHNRRGIYGLGDIDDPKSPTLEEHLDLVKQRFSYWGGCEAFYEWMEHDIGPAGEYNSRVDPEHLEAVTRILQEWDACAGQQFSGDTFTASEPMDIAYQLLKDEKPSIFGEDDSPIEKPSIFGGEEDEGTGHHLTVLGGDVKFEDKDTFNRKMQEWIDEHGMPSQMSSPLAGGIPLLAELWAMKNNIPHTPTNKESFERSTHFMMIPDVEGLDGHMERAMQSGKPVHFNYAHHAAEGNPFQVFNKPKQVSEIAPAPALPKPEPTQDEQDIGVIRQIVNQELGPRPATGLPTNAPANRRRIEEEQLAWDARFQELLDAVNIELPSEPESELELGNKRPVARRGVARRKSLSPFELAWSILKNDNVGEEWEEYIIDLWEQTRYGDDAEASEAEAELENMKQFLPVDRIIQDEQTRRQELADETKLMFSGPTIEKPSIFGGRGGQTMSAEAETEAYKGMGGMWYSYPSGRIIGPDLPEGITEVPPPN